MTAAAHAIRPSCQKASGAALTLSGGTLGAAALIEAASGGTLVLSDETLGSGALVTALSGATALLSGTFANSGVLIASGFGSLLDIASSTVISGGLIEVGNEIVHVESGGSENIVFRSNGSGGLVIEDSTGQPTAYAGEVSGFGGVGHADRTDKPAA